MKYDECQPGRTGKNSKIEKYWKKDECRPGRMFSDGSKKN